MNWSGQLEVRSALDGTVRNSGVARYAAFDDAHLTPRGTNRVDDEVISLVVETTQSHVRIAEAARTRFIRMGERLHPRGEVVSARDTSGCSSRST